MFRGSDFDRLAQQRVYAERDWIDAQPGLVAQGRAVCLFNAQNRSPQFLEELIERFNTRAQAKFYIEHAGGDFDGGHARCFLRRIAPASAEKDSGC